MIDVNSLHQFIDLICDKWQQFTFDSAQKDLAINAAQKELFAYYDGLSNPFIPGQPQAVTGFEQNRVISNELEPFKDHTDITIPNTGKILQTAIVSAIQADLGNTNTLHRVANILAGPNMNVCAWKRDDRIGYVTKSSIVPPDTENPVYNNQSRYYEFYPIDIGPARFYYLMNPSDVFWGSTIVNGRPVYNAGTSKQCFFKATSFHKLAFRALLFLGLNITEEAVIQVSQQMKTEN